MELSHHRATDRRMYNGCPSSDLKKELKSIKQLKKVLSEIHPNACVTYFPVEGKYMGFVNHVQVTKFMELEGDAYIATIKHIEGLKKQ